MLMHTSAQKYPLFGIFRTENAVRIWYSRNLIHPGNPGLEGKQTYLREEYRTIDSNEINEHGKPLPFI